MEKFTIKGVEFVATIESDDSHGTPWEECDGHGNVTAWQSSHNGQPIRKSPGQFVLTHDRGSYRLYDFTEACRTARRDGWGFAPGKLVTDRFAHSGKRKFRAYFAGFKFVGYVRSQFNVTGDPESCRKFLAGYGAWDDVELSDHESNLNRLVWLAGCDLRERGEIYFEG